MTTMSCSRAAPSAPKLKNADRHRYVMKTTTIYTSRVTRRVAFQSMHSLVARSSHTTQPTTQASPLQGKNATCLQSRAPEMNLFRSRNSSRHTASWRARPTVVYTIGCRRPVPELVQAGPAKKLPKWWNAISRAVFSSWKLKF